MKIAILSASLKKDLLLRMSDFLTGLIIESSAIVLSVRWKLDQRQPLEAILSRSDCFIILADDNTLSSSWMNYLIGYLRKEQDRIIFFSSATGFLKPSWLDGLVFCRDFLSLRDHILSFQEEWENRIAGKQALKTLSGMGVERANYNLVNAVRDNDRLLTGIFLESGLSPHIKNDRGVPLICLAARNGCHSMVQVLLAAGADINQVSEDRYNTPLMDAAAAGFTDLVRYLSENGADLEHKSKNGQTALLLAVGNQRIEAAKYLLEQGADPSVSDALGMTAVKYARLFREEGLLQLLPDK